MRVRWLSGVLVLTVAGETAAKPEHRGFTGDLGIGIALTTVPRYSTTMESHFGLAPLSLSLGGFVTPNVAILFRAAGTSYFRGDDQLGHNFYGPIVEAWPDDRFFVSGGVGFAIYGPNPLISDSSISPENGVALDFRVGVATVNARNNDFTLALEVIPGFYDETIMGYALVGAWKWY